MHAKCLLGLIALISSTFGIQAQSVSVNTVPQGMMSFPLPSGVTTYVSLPLAATPTYSGTVTSFSTVTASTVDSITVAGGSQVSATATTNSTTTLSTLSTTTGLVSGMAVTGAGIPSGTTLISVDSGTSTAVLSQATTASGGGISLIFSTPFASGALVTAGQPYFVKFLSGAETGRVMLITSNTIDTLSLDTTDHTLAPLTQTTPLVSVPSTTFDVKVGDSFEVFPGETLATLFGSGTTQDPLISLSGGANVGSADTVGVPSTLGAAVKTYFFDSNLKYWRLYPSSANANNTVIYPYTSLEITRNAATDTTLTLMGSVTEVPLLVKTLSSSTSFNSLQYAAGATLSSLSLASNPNLPQGSASSWQTGTGVGDSDTLNVWNPGIGGVGHFDVYYQLMSNSQWRKYPNGSADVSSFVIPAGTVIQINRQNNVSGATSFVLPTLPYSL